MRWWANDGTGLSFTPTLVGTGSQAYMAAVADMDRDGDPDIVSIYSGGQKLAWYDNTAGDGSAWTENIIESATGFWAQLRVGRRQRRRHPGRLRVPAGTNRVFFNDGSGLFLDFDDFEASFNLKGGDFFDIDADGDLDLTYGQGTSSAATGGWTAFDGSACVVGPVPPGCLGASSTSIGSANFANGSTAGDFDGDGDLDLAVSQSGTAAQVQWYENLGGGSSWSAANVLDGSGFSHQPGLPTSTATGTSTSCTRASATSTSSTTAPARSPPPRRCPTAPSVSASRSRT